MSEIYFNNEVTDIVGLYRARYLNTVAERHYNFSRQEFYPASTLSSDKAISFYAGSSGSRHGLWDFPHGMGYASVSWGDADIRCSADTQKHCDEIVEKLKNLAPREQSDEPDRIPVTFWTLGPNGPYSVRRKLDVPRWTDIGQNYTAKTSTPLNTMITPEFRPGRGGQLFLWHGPPGTGKTTALRALGSEWRSWCDLHYIVDPERFFGTEAAYMMQVLMNSSDEYEETEIVKKRWRLLVLEDCGELLATDARKLSGQGLSRFLNAVDGLIGQGLRIIILVTTNEELGKLHEAVQRPGRCAMNIEFANLKKDEVTEWIKAKNSIAIPSTSMSIAELYALVEGRIETPTTKTIGFGV